MQLCAVQCPPLDTTKRRKSMIRLGVVRTVQDVREEVEAARPGTRVSFAGSVVRGLHITSALLDEFHDRLDLDFKGAMLQDVVLRDIVSDAVRFQGAVLERVQIVDCGLENTDFSGAVLLDTQFRAHLNNASFVHTRLREVDFKGSLKGADFTGAMLQDVDFRLARILGVTGDGVVLRHPDPEVLSHVECLPRYPVCYTNTHLGVGRYWLSLYKWTRLSNSELREMDGTGNLLTWWRLNRDCLLDEINRRPALARNNSKYFV